VPKDAFLPGELAFGIGYRASIVSFEREVADTGQPRSFYLDLSGRNLKGYRAGVQYRPGRAFSIGAVYRNRVTYASHADEGTILAQPATNLELPFVLPEQVGGGMRVDVGPLGLAADVVYTFQSQNQRADLTGLVAGMPFVFPTVYDWQDAYTLHFGVEYRLGPTGDVPIRLGYTFDDQVADRRFPTAFGIPPAPTDTFSFGGGYIADSWTINVALSLSDGRTTTITAAELDQTGACVTCGSAGEYRISATGLYIDFSTEFGQ
jgi:long-subunit fatty acid transport protein